MENTLALFNKEALISIIEKLQSDRNELQMNISSITEELIRRGATAQEIAKYNYVKAVKMYRDQNNCSLQEAVDEMYKYRGI